MGRSSRNQADENRARIVQVASGLFRAHGVQAVAVADVMKAAGMTQGGFYKHFPSKDALAAEACALAFRKAAENWQHVAQVAAQDGRDVAQAIAAYYLSPKLPELTCPMIALASGAARLPADDPLKQAYSAGVQDLYDTFTALTASQNPEAREDRLTTLFTSMVGANMLTRAVSGVTRRSPGRAWRSKGC